MNNRGCNRGCSRGYIRGNSRGSGTAKFFLSVVLLLLGGAIGYSLQNALSQSKSDSTEGSQGADESKPLYWVAPMDPNYKRDKPGKSPMGMDLIPVYKESGGDDDLGPGTITISPEVVNNLGVKTVQAKMGQLDKRIRTVGYVQYNEDGLIHVHPRVEGWIERLHVKAEGEWVEKNKPLYDLYSPALVNAQEEYVLALERGNKRLIDAAENRLRALQFPRQTIQKLRSSRRVEQLITYFSIQSGVVDKLNVREGFYVHPDTTVMAIASLAQVWVEAGVLERQASAIVVGAPVNITQDYLPGLSWSGTVDYIYPVLDKALRALKVRIRLANPDYRLKPNMFTQVSIAGEATSSELLIPKQALIRMGSSDRVVLAMGDGKFKSIEVKVVDFDRDHAAITEGLNLGDKVVLSAQFLLDSESSKTSDFLRMRPEDDKNQAQVDGVINAVDPEAGVLNISREAIPKWNRGPATLDFVVQDRLDISGLKVGDQIRFVFSISPQREFVIQRFEHLHKEMARD